MLTRALHYPRRILAAAAMVLVLTATAVPFVGFELMPETDEGLIDVDVEYPVGTPVEETMAMIKQVEKLALAALSPNELDNVMTSAGPENWWQTTGRNEGEVELTLVPASQRDRTVEEVAAVIREAVSEHPASRIRVRSRGTNVLMRLMRGGGDRLSVEIRGHDLATAERLGRRVIELMREVPGVSDARIDREEGKPEKAIHLNRDRLADLGISTADVATAIEHYVLGNVATRLRDGSAEYDIRIRLAESDRKQLSQLARLPIATPGGQTIPLGTVANLEPRNSPASIERDGQERIMKVEAGIEGRTLGDIVVDVQQQLQKLTVPAGFTVNMGGEVAEQKETFSDLYVGLLLAIFLVYAVMAIQFESFAHPLIVMSAIPFAFSGVALTLLLTGTTFNMNSFLGAIVLVGIVVNNAIVFIDYVNLLRRRDGYGLLDGLIETGRRRLRPILMTTSTTALAMAPLALGIGEGAEVQAPLGRAIVGGLLFATAITLILIPTIYLIWERRNFLRSRASNALSTDV